eukprot:scaffold6563_cov32-Tisochrysis_lutea.AAC.2
MPAASAFYHVPRLLPGHIICLLIGGRVLSPARVHDAPPTPSHRLLGLGCRLHAAACALAYIAACVGWRARWPSVGLALIVCDRRHGGERGAYVFEDLVHPRLERFVGQDIVARELELLCKRPSLLCCCPLRLECRPALAAASLGEAELGGGAREEEE